MLGQGVDEEVPDGFPGLPHALSLVQGGAELFHGPFDLQQLLQGALDVAVLVHAARCELLPELAGHVGLLPHKAADVLDPVPGRHIWEGRAGQQQGAEMRAQPRGERGKGRREDREIGDKIILGKLIKEKESKL